MKLYIRRVTMVIASHTRYESVLCYHTAVGNKFFHYLQSILKGSPNKEGANSLVAYCLSSRT
jgi:hypothetical protein